MCVKSPFDFVGMFLALVDPLKLVHPSERDAAETVRQRTLPRQSVLVDFDPGAGSFAKTLSDASYLAWRGGASSSKADPLRVTFGGEPTDAPHHVRSSWEPPGTTHAPFSMWCPGERKHVMKWERGTRGDRVSVSLGRGRGSEQMS